MQHQCYRPWLGNVASGSIAELDVLGRTGGDRTGLGRTYLQFLTGCDKLRAYMFR